MTTPKTDQIQLAKFKEFLAQPKVRKYKHVLEDWCEWAELQGESTKVALEFVRQALEED